MKTRKTVFLALFALVISCGLVFFGCDIFNPSDPTPTPSAITFTVTAKTPSGQNTASLDIKFSAAVADLAVGDITLSDTTNVEKGSLTGGGTDWNLGITVKSPYAGPVSNVTVKINKSGVSSSSQTIGGGGIVNNESVASFTATADPVVNKATTLKITLSKEVTITSANEITITNGTTGKATKGALGGSKTAYTLQLTDVTTGDITVKITNAQVETNAKTVNLASETTPTQPGPAIPATSISIVNDDPKYSKAVIGTASGSTVSNGVEIGFDRKFRAQLLPVNATSDVDWDSLDSSIATVSSTGLVKGIKPGSTQIMAKARDSGIGTMLEINVVAKLDPVTMKVELMGSASSGGWISSQGTISATVSTGAISSDIKLLYGDRAYKLKTSLEDNTNNRINEQTVLLTPKTSSFFEISGPEPETGKDNDVSAWIFTLTPKTETLTNPPQKIEFQSAYKLDLKATLDVTVTYTQQTTATGVMTIEYYDSNSQRQAGGPEFSSTNKTIYMVVESKVPTAASGAFSVSAFDATSGDWITITPDNTHAFNVAGKKAVYKLTMKKESDWSGTNPNPFPKLKATVKDIKGLSVSDDTIQVKYN